MQDSEVTAMTSSVGKAEAERDGSTSSIGSSPEPGLAEPYAQEEPQQQKRKGGRKPVSLPTAQHDCGTCTRDLNVEDRTNQAP
jgi:hypothetical protein